MPEPSSSPPYSYTLQEWLSRVKFASNPPLSTLNPEDVERWLKSYFESQYPDPIEREWKYDRLYSALSYVDHHLEKFDVGKVAVVGETHSLITKDIWIAMWFAFAKPESDPSNPPSPEQVLFMVEMIAKERKR